MSHKSSGLLNICETISDKQLPSMRAQGHPCSCCSLLQQDNVCVLPSEHAGRTGTSGKQLSHTSFFPSQQTKCAQFLFTKKTNHAFSTLSPQQKPKYIPVVGKWDVYAPIWIAISAEACHAALWHLTKDLCTEDLLCMITGFIFLSIIKKYWTWRVSAELDLIFSNSLCTDFSQTSKSGVSNQLLSWSLNCVLYVPCESSMHRIKIESYHSQDINGRRRSCLLWDFSPWCSFNYVNNWCSCDWH